MAPPENAQAALSAKHSNANAEGRQSTSPAVDHREGEPFAAPDD
jgi:hypothetical protein